MADWGDFLNNNNNRGSMRNENFDEDVLEDHLRPKKLKVSKEYSSGSCSSAWHIPTSPKKVLKVDNSVMLPASSAAAPVNIPDWSKIYGKRNGSCGYDEEEEDEDDRRIPPHEWIARKLGKSQISCFSVFEGIGRTLKGRDLSKMRNAVLTKTGFIE